MNGKKIWLSSLAVALLGMGVVRAQGPDGGGISPGMMAPPPGASMPSTIPGPTYGTGTAPPVGQQYSLSKWILGERCSACCGPIGADGPIGMEIYMRTGVSFPIGSGGLSQALDAGWDLEAGGRTLFYNRDLDAAWTVDLSVTNIFNPGSAQAGQVNLQNLPLKTVDATGSSTVVNVPSLNVTPGNLNRTSVNLAVGREMWLLGTADTSHNDFNWRIGGDVGGRWGTQKLEFEEIQHFTSSFSGIFVSLHSDVEVPCGTCILEAGLRTEYGYTFSDILQTHGNSDLMDLNLMVTLGIRF